MVFNRTRFASALVASLALSAAILVPAGLHDVAHGLVPAGTSVALYLAGAIIPVALGCVALALVAAIGER